MPGITTDTRQVINAITNQIRDQYGRSSVLQELLQNADDAGAARFVLCGMHGLPNAANPLLKAPGLLVVNDGPISIAQLDGMMKASSSDKALDAMKVGRFGLGQKAIFNLCDAFVVQARIAGEVQIQHRIVNPYVALETAEASNAAISWEDYGEGDRLAMATAMAFLGFPDQSVGIYIPLRSSTLRPSPGNGFSSVEPSLEKILREYCDSSRLGLTLCALRTVTSIEIRTAEATLLTFQVDAESSRMLGPNVDVGRHRSFLGGIHAADGNPLIRFSGSEQRSAPVQADSFKSSPHWPSTITQNHAREPEKAVAHGAAILARSTLPSDAPVLNIFWGVFLPISDAAPEQIPLGDPSLGRIDLLLHGYFFVDSGRRTLAFEASDDDPEKALRARWNAMIRADLTLPLLLPAILCGFDDLHLSACQRHALVRALARSPWWMDRRADISGHRALAECLDGDEATRWAIASAEQVRALPPLTELSTKELNKIFPTLTGWARKRDITLVFDPEAILQAASCEWREDEAADLLETLDLRTFNRSDTVEALARLADTVLGRSDLPLARGALLRALRAAMRGDGNLAGDAAMAKIARHLPKAALYALPRSVENRQILRALAAASDDQLAIRANYVDSPITPDLSATVVIDWLTSLEPFLAQSGDIADQANAAATAIIGAGPSFSALLENERARHLKVIRARNLATNAAELLTLAEISDLAGKGRLFSHFPGDIARKLAAAVNDIAIYVVRLPDDSGAAARKLLLQQPSTPRSAAAVLRDAQRFGDEDARASLLEALLADEGFEPRLLRALAVGEAAETVEQLRLVALGAASAEVESVAIRVLAADPTIRIVTRRIADQLAPAKRARLDVRDLHLAALGALFLEAVAVSRMPALSLREAKALLASGLDDDVLLGLPLFRTTTGDLVTARHRLFRLIEMPLPASMRMLVAILDAWPEPELARIQSRVPAWTAAAQVRTALSTETPIAFCGEILEGIGLMEASELALHRDQLRAVRWLPGLDGEAVHGGDVLSLSPQVDEEVRRYFPNSPFIPFASLSISVRDHRAAPVLREMILPGAVESYTALELLLAEGGGLVACLASDGTSLDDLRVLACADVDVGLPHWSLLASVLNAELDSDICANIARRLQAPVRPDAMVRHLNTLAALTRVGSVGEAARRLHRAVYLDHVSELISADAALPDALLLPTRHGTFKPASAIAVQGAGLSPGFMLAPDYAEPLLKSVKRCEPTAGGAEPRADEPSLSDPRKAQADFAAAIGEFFEAWRGLVPPDAIVFILGLLGRDEAMSALARNWDQATRLRHHETSWADLDVHLRSAIGTTDIASVLTRTIFTLRPVTDTVSIVSAAGTPCDVPMASGNRALLVGDPMSSRTEVRDGQGHIWHQVTLNLVARPTSNLAEAREILGSFVEGLCPPLLLAMPSQRTIVKERFEHSFQVEQATIEETIAKLRDQSPSHLRMLVLPGDGAVRGALRVFESVPATRTEAIGTAKATLWEVLKSPDAAGELLAAVRAKIAQMGYSEDRVLFELLQNADDAYRQFDVEAGELRIEIEEDADQLRRLRIVHWGRPINHPGRGGDGAVQQGHENDLYNMLAINHSEKPAGNGVTGKFGLGFKTVHMVSSGTRIASGFVAARIIGGFVPEEWPTGVEAARDHARGMTAATLIDIPVDLDRAGDARGALDAFREVLDWLPATAKSVRRIVLSSGTGELYASASTLALQEIDEGEGDCGGMSGAVQPGLACVVKKGIRPGRALRIDLGSGYAMFIDIGRNGPQAIQTSSSLWNLVPLREQRSSRWLLDGPFDVDPGRTHIKAAPAAQAQHFASLGAVLAERLLDLFDLMNEQPATFEHVFDIDAGARAMFWERLAEVFAPDLALDRERELHLRDRGLGRLWSERPALPTGLVAPFHTPLRGDDVEWGLDQALTQHRYFSAVRSWPSMTELTGRIVSDGIARRMVQLGMSAPRQLTLAALILREMGPSCTVDVETAERIGALLTHTSVEDESLVMERSTLLENAARARFRSSMGGWASARDLAMASGAEDREHERAAFAPPENVLSSEYRGPALDFFKLARRRAGFAPNAHLLRLWANRASDGVRQEAFLRYLLTDSILAREVGAHPPSWMPRPLSTLRFDPLCAAWSDVEVTRLLAMMEQLPPYFPPPVEPEQPEPVSPADFLGAIHSWWVDNCLEERSRYAENLYPEGFDFAPLRDGDPTAWFTIFALAIFQSLGRTQDFQARAFIQTASREGWWAQLADLARTDDSDAWVERLEAWSDPDGGEQSFLPWRRCLVDLYTIARYLPEYIVLIRALPGAVRNDGPLGLDSLMRPYQSAIAGSLGVEAPSINRSIGIGLNWLIRELIRNDVFAQADQVVLHPYCWANSARVRRLLRHARIELGVPAQMEATRHEFDEMQRALGAARATFEGDFDLPLQLIARRDYRAELLTCLEAAGVDPSGLDFDDVED